MKFMNLLIAEEKYEQLFGLGATGDGEISLVVWSGFSGELHSEKKMALSEIIAGIHFSGYVSIVKKLWEKLLLTRSLYHRKLPFFDNITFGKTLFCLNWSTSWFV